MAKFVLFDDGNTIINAEHIALVCNDEEADSDRTKIWLIGDEDPIKVADDYETVKKVLSRLND